MGDSGWLGGGRGISRAPLLHDLEFAARRQSVRLAGLESLGSDEGGAHSNETPVVFVVGGKHDGTVAKPIVDSQVKRDTLIAERATLGLETIDTLAVGDGANDIPMLEAAGLGIAYHAKPRAAAAADAAVRVGDLTVLLSAQGIPRSEWVIG